MVKNELFIGIAFLCLMYSGAAMAAADSTQRTPLTIYSGGVGAGAFKPLNDELSDVSEQFFRLSMLNRFYFTPTVDLFLDIDAFFPGDNYGADFGLHLHFPGERVRPFIGAGVGVHYFSREHEAFGEGIGPSGTIHAGVALDLTETTQIELNLPFHLIGNDPGDFGVGLHIGLLFSKPYKHVRKIRV